jgi:predicted signal transduction protein with EAL and GGDEF domain
LTGLPNRELFREQIEQALDRCRRIDKQLALLFLDIDRFKQVNDSLGHSSGDLLLTQVADRLRRVVRSSDSIGLHLESGEDAEAEIEERSKSISRLGGDEFTILISDLEHSQDAARVARRVLHALSGAYTVGDQEVFVGGSIGIAVWPEDGIDSELLLQSADSAMYHAKARGGNTYEFFNASMNVVSARRLSVETRLRRALERNEFKLVYQPIRDAMTGRLSAAEALIRWVDADGESIGPDEFIPIAEETGLIVDIGAWVLRTACLQARDWRAAGHVPFRMSVNIAVGQWSDLGIVESVDQILFESGLSPGELELEITESSILDDNPNIIAAIAQLTDMGIGFALDDFGTGYSSLSALQRFPIERLKIDRSFVSGVDENTNDQALTSAIVALAKRLDLMVVAEGVETEAQARFLMDLGCDELQGYLFSRPLPPDDFRVFLELEAKAPKS